MIDAQAFFQSVRRSVFGGSLTKGQVDGMERILAYWQENYPRMPIDELAYVLATIYWETAHRMTPVKEMGGEAYLRRKRYYPYIGVGLVQVTWRANWEKFGIRSIEDGLSWPTALHAAFMGMTRGMYTGKKLSDYIGPGRRDYVNARRIINGTDKAHEIARIAENFRVALMAARRQVGPPVPPMPAPAPDVAFTYDQFREYLMRALTEDADIRGMILAVAFPDDPPDEPDPMDEPHEEFGGGGMDDAEAPYSDGEAVVYGPPVSFYDEPDSRYGR